MLAAATLVLVAAGGLVTSHDAGLSVPDWPTSYGWSMFTFPVSKWVGNIKYEHVHRLIASAVGLLTVVFAILVFRRDSRRGMRRLALVAVGAIVLQGVLGGLTVLYLLPTAVSAAHACLAQAFFCLTVAMAVVYSRSWRMAELSPGPGDSGRRAIRIGVAASAAIFLQLAVGAWMRHSGAGLAIPDFPTAFGRALPDHWSAPIAVHFAHRAGAFAVAAVLLVFGGIIARGIAEPWVRVPARIMLILLPVQILLGALAIWTRLSIPVTVAHVANGAALLASTVWLDLRLFQRERLVRERDARPARPVLRVAR